MDLQQTEQIIRDRIFKHVDTDATWIFLFGSRAYGKNDRTADYDIGLFAGTSVPGHTIVNIREDLDESMIPHKVDVVDFSQVSTDFKRIALNKIVIWNTPKNDLPLK